MVLITSLFWGEARTSDGKKYKDCIVTNDSSQTWNWNLDGTCHQPGITLEAILSVMHSQYYIILSSGMDNKLGLSPRAQKFLNNNVEYAYLQSEDAVKKYNELHNKGRSVAIFLHSTC
jgi:hypothetical protein